MMQRFLNIGNKTAVLEWDDARLDGFMSYLFKPWEVENSGSADVLFKAHADNSGFSVELPQRTVACPDERTCALEIEYAMTMYAQKQLSGHIQIHGACFGTPSGCVLIVGTHGIGKTTLALSAVSRGLLALSDDICPFDHDMKHLLGFPRPFKAADDILAMNPCPVPQDCPTFYATPEITYVFFHELPEKTFAGRLPLRYILFPERRREGSVEIAQIGQTEAMQLLLTQGFNYTDRESLAMARILVEILQRTEPLKLAYSDSFEAIDTITDLLS